MSDAAKAEPTGAVAAPAILPAREVGPPRTVGELFRQEERTIHRLNAVATAHLTAKRAAGLALSAIRTTPDLARCTVQTFFGSLMAATSLGLEPNTIKQHAFLIPYKRRAPRRDQNRKIMTDDSGRWIYDEWFECQLQIGYRGFVALYMRSPAVTSVSADAIYQADKFQHRQGSHASLDFVKALREPRFIGRETAEAATWCVPERGENRFDFSEGLDAAFCFTALRGGESFSVATLADIYLARSRSQTWNTLRDRLKEAERKLAEKPGDNRLRRDLERARSNYAGTPWVAFEPVMAAKTAIRMHARITDLDDDSTDAHISLAADMDGLGDAGVFDFSAMADPDRAREIVHNQQENRIIDAEPTEEGEDSAGGEETRAGSGSGETEATTEATRETEANPPDTATEPTQEATQKPTGQMAQRRNPF